jgi:hypothetical protein
MRFERAYMTQLHGMLDALAKPRPGPHGRDTRPYDRRLADAAIEWIGLAQAAGTAPTRGGTKPRITATIPFEFLRDLCGHGVIHTTHQATATLNPESLNGGCTDRENGTGDGSGAKVGTFGKVPDGIAVSARWLRMLACDAEILPAVLGSDGAILDLGTGTRLFTSNQRHAIGERDGHHCHFPDCQAPEKWCHAHHITQWADGGPTDVGNGALLCPAHHDLIHHDNWQVRMGNHGHPEYIPPHGPTPDNTRSAAEPRRPNPTHRRAAARAQTTLPCHAQRPAEPAHRSGRLSGASPPSASAGWVGAGRRLRARRPITSRNARNAVRGGP